MDQTTEKLIIGELNSIKENLKNLDDRFFDLNKNLNNDLKHYCADVSALKVDVQWLKRSREEICNMDKSQNIDLSSKTKVGAVNATNIEWLKMVIVSFITGLITITLAMIFKNFV